MSNQDFVDELSMRLRDDDPDKPKVQWTQSFLVKALNAAFSALVNDVPHAYMVRRTLALVEGTEQNIDSDLRRIVHMDKNVCPVTGKFTRAITKADVAVLDKACPNWRQDSPRGYIAHYGTDALDEGKFEVWPPAAGPRGDAPVVPPVPVDPGTVVATEPQQAGIYFAFSEATVGAFSLDSDNDQALIDLWNALPDGAGTNGAPGAVLADLTPGTFNTGNELDYVFDLTIRDIPVGWGTPVAGQAIQLNTFISLVPNFGGFGSTTVRDTDDTPLTFGDVGGLVAGDVLRFQATATGIVRLVAKNPTYGATQAEIDQYQIDLAAYNAAVEALAAFEASPGDEMVRGVFTKTPCVYTGGLTEPVAPVDPGPATVPDNIQTFHGFFRTNTGFNRNEIVLQFLPGDPSPNTVINTQAPSQEEYVVIFQNSPADWVGPNNVINNSPDTVYAAGTVVDGTPGPSLGGSSHGWAPEGSASGVYFDSIDDIGTTWNQVTMLVRNNTPTDAQWVITNPFTPTTAQDVIDYQAALTQFNTELAAYTADIAGTSLITDDFPVDKAHYAKMMEYALYYCYSRDDEQTANSGRASFHLQNFRALVQGLSGSETTVKAIEDAAE